MKNMIHLNKEKWKNQIVLSGIIFQVVFLLEILFFHDIVIVDPSVHNISYDNWLWFVLEWNPPEYWVNNSEIITTIIGITNVLFQTLFSINIIYIFIKIKEFSIKRVCFVLAICGLIALSVFVRYYIKYNVDFYRLYMYSMHNELISLYMIYCGRRAKKEVRGSRPTKPH